MSKVIVGGFSRKPCRLRAADRAPDPVRIAQVPVAHLGHILYLWAGASLTPRTMSKNAPVRPGDGRMTTPRGIEDMAEISIVYWRDIPAQVIAGKGRRGVKAPLSERFEQAIDRAAMKAGMVGTDAYLAEWRKADPVEVPGEDAEAAAREAARIETDYDQGRLKALIENDGWAR